MTPWEKHEEFCGHCRERHTKERRKCEACNGTGTVRVREGDSGSSWWVDCGCSDCEGAGYFYKNPPLGRLKEPKKEEPYDGY